MDYVIKFKVLDLGFGIYEKNTTVTAESEKEALKQIIDKFLVTEFISILKRSWKALFYCLKIYI